MRVRMGVTSWQDRAKALPLDHDQTGDTSARPLYVGEKEKPATA